ncbi:MAG: hypothetical protein AAGC85_09455 [Bacteroidota bacterium]
MLETYPVLEALILILGSGILGAWISSLLMKGSYKLKLSEQENKLKEKQESHDALFQRFKKLEESSEQFISGSREMESQFNRLNSRFKHTEEEKVLLQTSLKLCREESEDLKNQIATLTRVDTELESLETSFKQTQNDLLRLQDQQDAWINERADLLEQIQGLKSFRNMYQEMQPQFQESREEIDRLRSELTILRSQSGSEEAETSAKGFIREAQKTDTDGLKKEIQALTEKNEDYKKRIGLLSPFRAKYEEINQQYIAQQSEITRLGNEVEKLKNISAKAVNSSNDFQAKYETLLATQDEAPLTLEKVESSEVFKARAEDQNGSHTEKKEATVEEVAVEKVADLAPTPAPATAVQDNGIIDFSRIGVASVGEKDDLKKIKGIGPFIEEKLNKLGIFTFKQIANLNAEDEVKVSEAIGSFPGRIKRDTWVEQARSLSEEEEF